VAQSFDYIVAYSVFTNMPRADMQDLVNELQLWLKSGGAFAFTFIDPHHHSWPGGYQGDNLHWRLEREQILHPELTINIERIRREVEGARWFMLVNGTDVYVESDEISAYPPHEQRTCHVFHTEDYIRAFYPNARVLPPVNNEMQHCCVIRR
jgi:hypothetical protein